MNPQPLDSAALTAALTTLPGWRGDRTALTRTYLFPTFMKAIGFMHDCAPTIDAQDHHPNWTNAYRTVSIVLSTHDAGNRVTAQDVTLAHALERMAILHRGQ